MGTSKLLHAQSVKHLQHMLSARLLPKRVHLPCCRGNIDLFCNQIEENAIRSFVCGKHSAGIAEIDYQDGDAETVMIPTMLPHEEKVTSRECGQAHQLSVVFREGEQLNPFCGGQQLAARHGSSCSEYGGFQDAGKSLQNRPFQVSEVSHNPS